MLQAARTSPPRVNPAQQGVIDRDLLNSGFNCVLQMPTGTGKTWLAELAIEDVLRRGRRAIYLTPLRAQADELLGRWRERFAPHPVGVFTGDYGTGGKRLPVPFEKARLLLLTPEKMDVCTRHWRSHWSWIPEVDLLVVDEFHLLGDRERGPRLEGAIGRLRRLNPFLRVLGLSATLGNQSELADWLEGVEYLSTWRPVPLRWRVERFRRAIEKPVLLMEILAPTIEGGGRSLVFVQSRRRAEQLACQISAQGLVAEHHHAGLDVSQRTRVEQALRSGRAQVVVATGTLEMGLNLPVRQVVLYDLQAFDGHDYQPLPVWSAWQRGGRAGRPGLDEQGEVVLLVPSWGVTTTHYLEGRFEPVRSGLSSERAVAEQILVEVASGLCRSEMQVERALHGTLGGFQRILRSPLKVVQTMLDAGMLCRREDSQEEERQTTLKATRLGRIAVRHMLSPSAVLFAAERLRSLSTTDLRFLDLLLIAIASGDCEPLLPPDFEELDHVASLLGKERSSLLASGLKNASQTLSLEPRRLLAVLKTALVARVWTRTGDAEATAKALGVYPFEVYRLMDSLERILAAMVAILDDPDTSKEGATADEPRVLERLRALLVMVQAGLDEDTVTLTLVGGIGPTLARRLHAQGIRDIEDLAGSEAKDLASVRGISAERAKKIIRMAEEILPIRSAWCLREHGAVLSPVSADWPEDVDPYRLGRAMSLSVVRLPGAGWQVSGGTEPHVASGKREDLRCDCADSADGRVCKHILAVRLHLRDSRLTALSRRLSETPTSTLDLHRWWLQGRQAAGAR